MRPKPPHAHAMSISQPIPVVDTSSALSLPNGALLLNPGEDSPLVLAPHLDPSALPPSATGARALLCLQPGLEGLHLESPVGPTTTLRGAPAAAAPHVFEAWRTLCSGPRDTLALLRAHRLLLKHNLSRTFFRTLQTHLPTLSSSWSQLSPTDDPHVPHALSITLLCRLMFLYFLQARGWLPSPTHLAQTLLQPNAFTRLHRDLFRPLDTPDHPGPLPYLNGGLFAPAPVERAHPHASIPDAALTHLLTSCFEPFTFASAESPTHIAIDPHMLGAVFEGLMHPADRERSGTFYTPPSVVQRVVHDALSPHAHLPAHSLRVLDPAAGSGAFLLGALDHIRARRESELGESPAQAVLEVLRSQLFAVDTSATAITICQLRLWLALLSVLPEPLPLPNLSAHIRQGDALRQDLPQPPPHLAAAYRAAAADYCAAHGPHKPAAEQRLSTAERAMAHGALLQQASDADQRAGELRPNLDLFVPAQLSPNLVSEQDRLRSRASALRDRADRCLRGEDLPRFDRNLHFAHVLADGGFTAILGNPPWVSLSHLGPTQASQIRRDFPWTAGAGTPFGSADLSTAFLQLATDLVAPAGTIGFLLPSKFLSGQHARVARQEIANHHRLLALRDLHGEGSLFSAQVVPCALTLQRTPQPSPHSPHTRVYLPTTSFRVPTRLIATSAGDPWTLLPQPALELLQLLREFPRLSQHLTVRFGVKTGLNRAFIPAPEAPESLPLARGANIRAFHVKPGGRVLFPHDPRTGEPLPELSRPAQLHLAQFQQGLRARVDLSPRGVTHQLFRVYPESLGHRVLVRDIGRRLEAAYVPPLCEGGPVALNTTYLVAVPDALVGRRLEAWLNSPLPRFVAACLSDRALSGFRRFLAGTLEGLPLPPEVLAGDPLPPELQELAQCSTLLDALELMEGA